jgi:hypothetical protein
MHEYEGMQRIPGGTKTTISERRLEDGRKFQTKRTEQNPNKQERDKEKRVGVTLRPRKVGHGAGHGTTNQLLRWTSNPESTCR